MQPLRYIFRSLRYYWKPQAAGLAGAAIATAVLTGALLTGYSVRASLRELALSRLGAAESLLASRSFFREALASSFEPEFPSAPIISLEAHADLERGGRRSLRVDLHAVDARFYAFHGVENQAPEGREALLSPDLARELDVQAGDTLLLRVEEPSVIPREYLYGRKEETGRVLRYRVAAGVSPRALGDFALQPRQSGVRAVFVPLRTLQRDLRLGARASAVLLRGAGSREDLLRRLQESYSLEDVGLRLAAVDGQPGVSLLEHESTVLDDRTVGRVLQLAQDLRILARPFLAYLANKVTAGSRYSAYALVAGADIETLAELNRDQPLPASRQPPILLNEWLAADLGAQPGDTLLLEYYVWAANGELATSAHEFQVAGTVPLRGLAADRRIAPEYPGITDRTSLASWDPPFPIDLKQVKPRDEEYWKLYRTTPKAWVPLPVARQLWGTRFGSYSSIRLAIPPGALEPVLRAALDPLDAQFSLLPVREQALSAAQGSTDFGEYFIYFSFVLVTAALLLMGLFSRLAIEQRLGEIGLLRAVGLSNSKVRQLFQAENLVVGLAGALSGVPLGIGWAWFILEGLRRWWIGATGTTLLTLHVHLPLALAGGLVSLGVAWFALWLALRRYEPLMPKRATTQKLWQTAAWAWGALSGGALGGLTLLAMGAAGLVPPTAGFFGAAALLLAAWIGGAALWLRQAGAPLPARPGLWPLALKNTAWRPGRSLLCLTLVALAAFLLVSLETFRQEENSAQGIWAESLAPVVQDPHQIDGLPAAKWTPFRLRPGDDISCLNLYEPRNPRILGLPESYYHSNPLPIVESLAQSEETRANPWLLLDAQLEQGVVPAIVDKNSMTYILHKRLGDTVEIERAGAAPLKLRLVAATAPGLFQSELLIAERNFVRLFPTIPGWRAFLIDAPITAIGPLEEALASYGFDAQPVAERLASYHRVENTYLSTFQMLGGFGLLLGVLGLSAVMWRNVLERRAELGLLAAVGFDTRSLQRLVLYENLSLLGAGLGAGTLCALLAVAPSLASRGAALPLLRVVLLLSVVFAAGALTSWLAVRLLATRQLIAALRHG